jgi:uncharacterized repeat protein (TIGR01451 family)
MNDSSPDSASFEALSRELLNKGITVRFQARGASMSPCIRDRQIVHVTPVIVSKLRKDDIVLTKDDKRFLIHRLVVAEPDKDLFITRGDCGQENDPPVRADQILGLVVAKEFRFGRTIVQTKLTGFTSTFTDILTRCYSRVHSAAGKLAHVTGIRQRFSGDDHASDDDLGDNNAKFLTFIAFLLVLLAAPCSRAQVAVDTSPSTNATADLTGPGTQTLSFTHTTSATANRVLLVGVSMNIANATATVVSGVTYNGTALTLVGAHNDAGNTRRVEQWYLLNPASGTNLPIVVSVNVSAAATIGVVAGATDFTGVDQTVPLSPFVSADGAAPATNSQLDVPSVINGMVFDTLAVGMEAVTVNGPQVSQWNAASGGANANAIQDLVGAASSRSGAPSVPISESFNEALNLTSAVPKAVALNLASVTPTTVTLTLTKAANAFLGTTVYTGTITGGGGTAYVGDTVVVAGFINANDNGTFTCTASTATTITLNNRNGVAQTHAATATVTTGTVYNGTITGGAGNAFAGDTVVVSGFTNGTNNGTFVVSASTATTLTLNNVASIAETNPGTAMVEGGAITTTTYLGTITGGASNGFAGDSFVIAGFTNAGNNGTFTCTASTASALTCSNAAGVAETNAGTATTGATSNWALGAVSINPTAADIGVSTIVGSAVFVGQNTTYTITVSNSGPSAANAVVLKDTLATGMTLVSVTPSVGTCVTTTNPITCTIGNMNSGTTATVTVIETAATSGAYANTAVVSDSGTPPDPNSGNNTFVSVATVQSAVCGAVSKATAGSGLTGVLNTYYPGKTSVAAGATSITIGAATGGPGGVPTAIAAGNLLLVIQMQDAAINDSNSVLYGNGSTGQGFTALNSAGDYEFVTATNAVGTGGGTVNISGAGLGNGLVFPYNSAAASNTAGQSTFQVIVVPQYTTVSFNSTTPPSALAWNGSTGGVLTLDASSTLTLNGATVSVDGAGFRGGAGMQLNGGVGGNNTDYFHAAPAAYTGAVENGVDAPKGEGIAGTPLWLESAGSYAKTTSKYPSGSGADGSSGRGAPGNAGGGGTDGDPTNNDQNAGGGGGGNGGAGGFGGDSWNTNLSVGGEGGIAFPATINRVAMGGGGGAGTRNNSDGDTQASSGSAGGGIIIVRTAALSGIGTFTANGIAAYNATANDAGGGGGAGGAIVILSANGGEGGLTLQANGGRGGNAWEIQPYSIGNRHGPGGGGGGGVVLVSGPPASLSVSGGTSGLTLNPGVPYGATPGTAGTSVTNANISQTSGTQSGAQCTPDMTLAKSLVGTLTRGLSGIYNLIATNVSPFGSTSASVTVNDTLPVGVIPTSASGAGWSCAVASQTVSCVDANIPLGPGASYPAIAVNVNVAQSAPATITNIAQVGGGGEINLANDTAINVANVGSTADLSVSDSASPNPVSAGANIAYTQFVTNNGPSAADNATIAEAVPANTTFVSVAAPVGWNCVHPPVGGTGNVVCTDLNMAGNTAATFSVVVKVGAAVANGTVVTNTITASSSVSDPNTANNTASASTLVGTTAFAEMTVTNSNTPDPVIAGNNITYTQIATNVGSATAQTPTFAENTPLHTTFVSIAAPPGTTCTTPLVGGTGAINCSAATAPPGSSGTVTLVLKVVPGTPSGTQIIDTVTVNATNQAFGANSASVIDYVGTATQADLALSTAVSPVSVIAGNNITYTQTISNNGPSAASTVTFTQNIPTGTTFVSASAPAGWTCAATTSVTCTNPSVAANYVADIIVVFAVPATDTTSPITATSSVSSSVTTDPNLTNNSNTTNTPLVDACDLTVTNTGTPSPVTAGGNIIYTQTIYNNGISNCSTGSFSEATPANTTWVSVSAVTTGGGTWTCPNSAPVSCSNPSVPPGSRATITAVYNVPAGTAAGTVITDTATATSATHDTNPADNTATSIIGVAGAGQADLSVTETASPNPVTAGQNITYSQTVANAGPAAAATVTLTENVPVNTTFVSLIGPGGGWSCTSTAPYMCNIASLATGAPATFTFTVQVNPTVAMGTLISDTASVASSVTVDPNLNNNTVSTIVAVADSADLSVTNSATPVPVLAGGTITYTQVVTNAGPSSAASASLNENTPSNTTFQSIAMPSGWSCTTPTVGSAGAINCTDPSFAAGNGSFTLVVKVTPGTAAGTAVNDTVTVSSSTPDPNPANNTATANDVVALGTQADLVTTNSAAPASVAAGNNVTYTQSVTNLGPAAAATGATFTQSTPPNTNFQSIAAPSGWGCVTPAVGATGTITCTDGNTIAVNGTANFTLLLQVNAGTPTGTNIAETATATVSNIVPNLTTNSATANVVVANANSADMAIVKTATPNGTVREGDPLTYSLAVTNNGPATATNVIVTDTLPPDVTYLSSNPPQCSEANGIVTCLLGTMNNGGTATATILTLAAAPGIAINTATVAADQSDPNLANNTSTQTEIITAPTKITLQSFNARVDRGKSSAPRAILSWKTGAESHNLGYNIFREENGQRVRLNPSLIAGSALMMAGALPKHAGKTYTWIDSAPTSAAYWLEDVDVNGARTMHGPVTASAATVQPAVEAGSATATSSQMFSELNQPQPSASENASHEIETLLGEFEPTAAQQQRQFELAEHPAIKLYVKHEGWHNITQPELIQAGLDPNVDPALLHLYAEAMEQPIAITGATSGPGGFGPKATLQFYGTGIDTQYSGSRVYWLVTGNGPGQRVQQMPLTNGSNQPPASFRSIVEVAQHTTYFAALITTDGNNFFGPLVSATPTDQTVTTPHLDKTSTDPARIEVILQGIILGFPHDVAVSLNGVSLGNVTFTGQAKGTYQLDLPPNVLQDRDNTVTLTSQNGEYDTSLLQSVRIEYPHTYTADSDRLKFTGRPGEELEVAGFTAAPAVVLDITDPNRPVQLTPEITKSTTTTTQYTLQVQVPWSSMNRAAAYHTLLAVAPDRLLSAATIRSNHPSHWHSAQRGSDIVMISHGELADSLAPLVQAHRAQGQSASVVLIDDLYDEFTFGERHPAAIRAFLQTATKVWHTPPHYLLLNGRASLDPRNYLGFGHLDLVPTKIVPAAGLMTASDDWFSDFNNTGIPTIATGRFPVTSPADATLVANKVATYEGQSTNGPWTSQALMVADINDGENFQQDAQIVQAQLPQSMQATDVFATPSTIAQDQQQIITSINSGQVLVNYSGHGSEDQWSGDNLFDNTAATALTNGSFLPVFLTMDCLNGFFQDVYEQPLGVTLMLAPNGGAVAVLASSGLNQPAPQTVMNKLIVQSALRAPYPALGDAIIQAKSAITDLSVRRTFNLLGDPAMKFKQTGTAATSTAP